ncbi:GEVED domain-containing protein [Gimesia algae]|uniref:NHL repeat protein n=1 Tax=Gimesia algae TaxID=2527971 RepID=A0A517VID2_9PLAN|nr:GEVED domain-containing protein [Gimesia algae]QDT92764.1 NHL repeat protein [Gimesia algae]
MMFTRTKRRHQPGRIGSFLNQLLKGRNKRLRNQRLNSFSNSYSTVEFLEDRTLLSATNALLNTTAYESPGAVQPALPDDDASSQPINQLNYKTPAQLNVQKAFSDEELHHMLNDPGQIDIPSNPLGFDTNENEDIFDNGDNNIPENAEHIDNFGTGQGDEFDVNVQGYLSNATTVNRTASFYFPEDNDSIPQANFTALSSGESISIRNATIGDGLNGSDGTGTGDFDFYEISGVKRGDIITALAEDVTQFNGLNTLVAIYSSSGTPLFATTTGGFVGTDSYLSYTALSDGTYYILVSSSSTGLPSDANDPTSGNGVGTASSAEGDYHLTIGLNATDVDYYSVDLEAGDILGANVFGAGQIVSLYQPDGTPIMRSSQYMTGLYPEDSPLPGDGNAAASFVAPTAGTYFISVSGNEGFYDLELRAFRPVLETQPEDSGAVQTLYIDFDGAEVDPSIFYDSLSSRTATLSSMDAFLSNWELSDTDEDVKNAVIDAIMATIKENFADIGANGNNGEYFDPDTDAVIGTPGDYGIRILNSRDNPGLDEFNTPHFTRVIVGGTINELGIGTLGIAESIDVGNFDTTETAVVLLDQLSSTDPGNQFSLNNVPRNFDTTMTELIGVAIGNIVSHEAGHLFGLFHTGIGFNSSPQLADHGGFTDVIGLSFGIANIIGIGNDGIFGTADDTTDVDFGTDLLTSPFSGTQDSINTLAFGLSTAANYGLDFGDAPSNYPTLLDDPNYVEGGARHTLGGGLTLGASVDYEVDGQTSLDALGDGADENGVTFLDARGNETTSIAAGDVNGRIRVNVSGSGYLQGWIDFNRDGVWDVSEQIFVDEFVTDGDNPLSFTVPTGSDFVVGETYARFRLSSVAGIGVAGLAPDGEVEDYQITLTEARDGEIVFDAVEYEAGNLIKITVTDGDLFGAGTVNVTVTSSGGDSETVVLTETVSGKFEGSIQSSPGTLVVGNGILEVVFGETITAAYADADSGEGQPGNFLDEFIPAGLLNGPRGLIFMSNPNGDENLFVSNGYENSDGTDHTVKRFDGETGNFIDDYIKSGGVDVPNGLVFDADYLYVTSSGSGEVLRYDRFLDDTLNGVFIGAHTVYPDGTEPLVPVVAPLSKPGSIVRNPTSGGNFYVADIGFTKGRVLEFGSDGSFIKELVTRTELNSRTPSGLAFDEANNTLFVSILESNEILRFDLDGNEIENTNGGAFIPAGTNGLANPRGLAIGPDGNLYVANGTTEGILRFDMTGSPVESGNYTFGKTIQLPYSLTFGPDNNLYVVDSDLGTVLRFAGPDGTETPIIKTITADIVAEFVDFGDAPESFPNLAVDPNGEGAQHAINDNGLHLGANVSDDLADPDQESPGAELDTYDDGILLSPIVAGDNAATVTIISSGSGFIDAWIDLNNDGDWNDPYEKILTRYAVVAGVNAVSFDISHAEVVTSTDTTQVAARFRLSSAGGLSATGKAADGEVEDYLVSVIPQNSIDLLDNDPNRPGKTALFITGTLANDNIFLSQTYGTNIIMVRINGVNKGEFAPTGGVYIWGLAGDDTITVDDTFYNRETMIFGGLGNDILQGGRGNDVLVGGDGHDTLEGGPDGFDILIGGKGLDYIRGHNEQLYTNYGSNGDILIGGSTVYDNGMTQLFAIYKEWISADPFGDRVNSVRTRVQNTAAGVNNIRLDSTTVFDDGELDRLYGAVARGDDWFLLDLGLDINNAGGNDIRE